MKSTTTQKMSTETVFIKNAKQIALYNIRKANRQTTTLNKQIMTIFYYSFFFCLNQQVCLSPDDDDDDDKW